MVDDTRSNDRGSGAVTQPGLARRPGLIRSIVHRLAGERSALPVEGRLASFTGATRWLNSQPLTPEGLRGRVVLVDFWTYTCVNWLRTLPYLRAWAAKYADGVYRAKTRGQAGDLQIDPSTGQGMIMRWLRDSST
jgi:thiol-disulfide isomerase/thioredoxin